MDMSCRLWLEVHLPLCAGGMGFVNVMFAGTSSPVQEGKQIERDQYKHSYVEVGNAGNSPRVLTLKQRSTVEKMMKKRMIGESGKGGRIDLLLKGTQRPRKGKMQRSQLLHRAGNTEDVEGNLPNVVISQTTSRYILGVFLVFVCLTGYAECSHVLSIVTHYGGEHLDKVFDNGGCQYAILWLQIKLVFSNFTRPVVAGTAYSML